MWHGKQMLAAAHSGVVDTTRLVLLPATATKVPSRSGSGTILDGSCPGHGALLAALWSCAKHWVVPRRSTSAGRGTAKAPVPSSSPTALLSYSPAPPLPLLHLIATLRPDDDKKREHIALDNLLKDT
jgi:hypothetical protein